MAIRAKKNKKSKQSKSRKKLKAPAFPVFQGEKLRIILGIILLVVSVYLLIAFISFIFYGAVDQSKLNINWHDLVMSPDIKVRNKAGKTGAFVAEKVLNQGFGLSALIMIYLLAITGIRAIGGKIKKFGKQWLYGVIIMILLSITLGFIFPNKNPDTSIYAGGAYGEFISSWLSALVGKAGLALLILIAVAVLLITISDRYLSWMKNLFIGNKPDEQKPVEENELADDDAEPIEVEESIGKEIDDDDIVRAIFEEEEPQNEVKEDDLELSVEQKKEEEEVTVKRTDLSELEDYDPTLELSNFKLLPVDLLESHSSGNAEVGNEELIANKNKIVETLRHYKIEITKIKATIGPTITLYEIVPAPGVRIAKIKNLEDDIALSLAALGIRIIAPIPGRGTIGIEVPNRQPEIVSMRSIVNSKKFQESKAELPIGVGKTISNETYILDLVKMPHILIAGATGQGKSVGINAIITSLLYKKHPAQLKFVFIDPKKVELSLYSVLEYHYLAKLPNEEESVITDIQKVKNTLNSVNIEMDTRYNLLKKAHARNIKEYNKKFISRKLNPEKGHKYLPYIVVVIDEFADLIMTAGKEVEMPIARIAQLARAVGIHMIIATQRPSTNIITGVIKANFPARIAFKVASMVDSRTILDQPGANQLIGKGDMLISVGSNVDRVQCAFVDTPEVDAICSFISEQRGYPAAFMLPEYTGDDEAEPGEVDLKNRDDIFEDAARVVVSSQTGSTSMIQRRFSIGYNRAGRVMDQLEAAGIVGSADGSKARQVLIQDEYTLEQLLNSL